MSTVAGVAHLYTDMLRFAVVIAVDAACVGLVAVGALFSWLARREFTASSSKGKDSRG